MASASDAGSMGSTKKASCTSSASSECRFEKALRSIEARVAKDAAHSAAAKMEAKLRGRFIEVKLEEKERARQEWLETYSIQRAAEYQDRLAAVEERREAAKEYNRAEEERLIELGKRKALAEEERVAALAQLRADEEALNRDLQASREVDYRRTVAKGVELEKSRQEVKRKQQDDLAQRRAQCDRALARKRAESIELRRVRAQESSSRIRAQSQQDEDMRRRKEARFHQKIQKAEAEQERRKQIMEQIKQIQQDRDYKVQHLKDLAWQASVTNREDDYRREIEEALGAQKAAFPQLSSAPTTPRSPASFSGFSPSYRGYSPRIRGSSQERSKPRFHSPPSNPALLAPPAPQAMRARAEPISPAGGCSPCSSRSSIAGSGAVGVSPRRKLGPGGRSGPVASSQSLGSTRCSLQASATELEAA
eukprot:TRINITY_DN113102_c0_g1_i1.p1 TRINITY_DN113102_c0_g1~~TRINITY_DN113102_c0_g1_i1.p1  ORF type:complete len:449 (+),score=90.91 TRINITY_DN113102_c0_g1_i1:83-1348(+)